MMKRQKKKYDPPSHPYSEQRLREEIRLIGTYGLRNKKGVWKIRTRISELRHRARDLLGRPEAEQEAEEFLRKLYKLGLLSQDDNLETVLKLEARDLLEHRLQTIVHKKGIAKTIWQARQMVVHGHIVVETDEKERVITSPSYIVKKDEKVKIHPQSSYKQDEEKE